MEIAAFATLAASIASILAGIGVRATVDAYKRHYGKPASQPDTRIHHRMPDW